VSLRPAPNAAAGIAFTAITGMRHSETHVACTMNATQNRGGEVLILSKRESLPSWSTRWNRKEPTDYRVLVGSYGGKLGGLHGKELTSGGPDADRGAQNNLSPVEGRPTAQDP